MADGTDPAPAARQCEALISMTALYYIEEHRLLDANQLDDAKQGLRALFLRTSGAETLLRRLIEVLKVKRNIQSTFSSVSSTVLAVRRSVEVMTERVDNLRRVMERSPVSAEVNAKFVGPFLSFSIRFLRRIENFEKALEKYLTAREHESRAETIFRIAKQARERLRQRLTGSDLGQANNAVESRIKGELDTSLNYEQAEAGMKAATKLASAAEKEVQIHLRDIQLLGQCAVAPSKRERFVTVSPDDDMYIRFAGLKSNDVTVNRIKLPATELFTLYQRAHGVFQLDFDRLRQALTRLHSSNSGDYFRAKAEDRDMTAKQEKLQKIEALIQFLERGAQLMSDPELDTLTKFSKGLSDIISEPYAAWKFASEELLPAKVRAEAELAQMA